MVSSFFSKAKEGGCCDLLAQHHLWPTKPVSITKVEGHHAILVTADIGPTPYLKCMGARSSAGWLMEVGLWILRTKKDGDIGASDGWER